MPDPLATKTYTQTIEQGILATLAFFSLYDLPLSAKRVFELLYRVKSSQEEVNQVLADLVSRGKVIEKNGLYALKPWNDQSLTQATQETEKRWRQVDKYFGILSNIPFVEHISIIHSLAIGNVNQESDIDFFVVTKPNRVYFVRSMIIVLFRALGVYRTRTQIAGRLSFGYYLSANTLDLSAVEGKDSFMAFWFASHIPILGEETHQDFLRANAWIREYFPNYSPSPPTPLPKGRGEPNPLRLKTIFEVLLWLPALLLEPILRQIHIRHTFNLPENHWPTSTTIANKDVLKLQAVSNRREINEAFERLLQSLF